MFLSEMSRLLLRNDDLPKRVRFSFQARFALSHLFYISKSMSPKKTSKTLSKTILVDPWALLFSKVKIQKHSVFSTLALPTCILSCVLQVQIDVAENKLQKHNEFLNIGSSNFDFALCFTSVTRCRPKIFFKNKSSKMLIYTSILQVQLHFCTLPFLESPNLQLSPLYVF